MTTKRIRTNNVLQALFTSQARLAVLQLLVLNAPNQYYLRQIAALARQPVRAVQRELARLEAVGLVMAIPEGNRKYYHANRESPVFADLRALLVKTIGLGDVLRNQLASGESEIALAFLFGSYARSTDSGSSDIDLMIVGSISGRTLARLLAPARAALGREINSVVMTPSEFHQKAATQNNFLVTVLQEPKIYLIGGEDDSRRLAGTGTVEAPQDQPRGDK